MDNLVIGLHPVMEALKSERPLERLMLAREVRRDSDLVNLAQARGIAIERVARQRLDELVPNCNHQGIVAVAPEPGYLSFEELLARLQLSDKGLVIILDHIQDPRNLGAILRVAEAAGAAGVIIPTRRAAALTPAAVKAAAGAIEYIPVIRVGNIVNVIKELQKIGFWIVGAEAGSQTGYTSFSYSAKTGLVLGGEGQGISRLVSQNCDVLVGLPMLGQLNSLNVAVAAGVLSYEVIRQQKMRETAVASSNP